MNTPTGMNDPLDSLLEDPNALPPGTRFGELEILATLGVGGFGIVYLAQDHALDRRVAIKEYMPAQLAERGITAAISVRSAAMRDTFEVGLRSFVNEARLLARFDHPALVRVYRFWEANGTAYMVMPYLEGHTLKKVREGLTEPPDEAWIVQRMLPLLDALEHLHADHVFHRDVAPDNILMLHDGASPMLLDFGAARQVIGERTHSLTAIFKPSYAAIEQYGETTTLKQGPWTDIYSVGAVMHYLLTGQPPPLATTRAVVDETLPLAHQDAWSAHSEPFRAAIDWALAVRPADRPKSVAELRRALKGEVTVPLRPKPAPPILASPGVDPRAYEPTQVIVPVRTHLPSLDPTVAQGGHEAAAGRHSAGDRRGSEQTAEGGLGSAAPQVSGWRRNWIVMALGGGAAALLVGFWAVLANRTPPGEGAGLGASSLGASAPATAAAGGASSASSASVGPVPASGLAAVGPSGLGASAAPGGAQPVVAAVGPVVGPTAGSGVPNRQDSARTAGPGQTGAGGALPAAARASVAVRTKPVGGSASSAPSSGGSSSGRGPAPATAGASAHGALDPREACEGRQLFAYWHCIQTHCDRPAYAEHAECRAIEERRNERRERRNR